MTGPDRGGFSTGLQSCSRSSLASAARGLPLPARLHLQVRLGILPWDAVLEAFSNGGSSLLDVGCGHGLLAFLLKGGGYEGLYTGIDIDGRKTSIASAWLGTLPGVTFPAVGLGGLAASSFDQAALLDVLYLLPRNSRQQFVDGITRTIAPGGRLIVLTSGGGPSWKRKLDRLEETLAVGLGITRGETVEPCDGDEVASLLHSSGLEEVRVDYIGRGYAHGYELVRGTARPTG